MAAKTLFDVLWLIETIFLVEVVIVIAYQVLSASELIQSQTSIYVDIEGAFQKYENIHTKHTLY